ncbi:MAG: radical SAM/SPASM domain-containing protein [Thermodesulfobacteriota bacterium]
MSKSIFQKLFPRRQRKSFSTWQIELTTRCPLECGMCTREGLEDWQHKDMNIDDFKKLIPYLKDVERVVLEGWGESLLHKNIIEIIRLVKAEGSEVGFVTSGKGLNKEYISELINAGVDFIGFSLSGGSSKTHNSIRVNSDFQNLLKDIKTFNEIKAGKKLKKPALHIVYLMLKDNIFEIPAMIGLAKGIGIENIILINLIHISNEWQEKQHVFTCLKKSGDYEEILKEAETKAEELKINLTRHSLSPTEVSVCEENPLKNIYVSVDGDVSPCVYLNPPASSPFLRIFCGNRHSIGKVTFGNIFKEPFHAIWSNERYVQFRRRFTLRKRRSEGIYSFFLGIDRLRGYETASLPEPPEQCATCHKILGV